MWTGEANASPDTDSWGVDDFQGDLKGSLVFDNSKGATVDTFPACEEFDPTAPAAQPGAEPVTNGSTQQVNNSSASANQDFSSSTTQIDNFTAPPDFPKPPVQPSVQDFPKVTVETFNREEDNSTISGSVYSQSAIGSVPSNQTQHRVSARNKAPTRKLPTVPVEMPHAMTSPLDSLGVQFGILDMASSAAEPSTLTFNAVAPSSTATSTSLYGTNDSPGHVPYPNNLVSTSVSNTAPGSSQATPNKQDNRPPSTQGARSPPSVVPTNVVQNNSAFQPQTQTQSQPSRNSNDNIISSTSTSYHQSAPTSTAASYSSGMFNSDSSAQQSYQPNYHHQSAAVMTSSMSSLNTMSNSRTVTAGTGSTSSKPPNLPAPTNMMSTSQVNATNMAAYHVGNVPMQYMLNLSPYGMPAGDESGIRPQVPQYFYEVPPQYNQMPNAAAVSSSAGTPANVDSSPIAPRVDVQSPSVPSTHTQHTGNQPMNAQQASTNQGAFGGYHTGFPPNYYAYAPVFPVMHGMQMNPGQQNTAAYPKGGAGSTNAGYYPGGGSYDEHSDYSKPSMYGAQNAAPPSSMRQANTNSNASDMSSMYKSNSANMVAGNAGGHVPYSSQNYMMQNQHMMQPQDKVMGGRSGHSSMKKPSNGQGGFWN